MLNLVMTHSPRLAAMTTNKPLGEDLVKNHNYLHRLAWLQRDRAKAAPLASHSLEQSLRERTA